MSDLRESSIMSSVMESVRDELSGDVLKKLEELWLSKMSELDAPGRLGGEIQTLEDPLHQEEEEEEEEDPDVEIIACASGSVAPPVAHGSKPLRRTREEKRKKRSLIQMDGANDSSDDDIDNDEDDEDEDDEDEDDEDEDDDGDNIDDEDNEEGGHNVVVCQYDKITRARNKWKFHLKDGIMHLNGKDYVFQRANGDAECSSSSPIVTRMGSCAGNNTASAAPPGAEEEFCLRWNDFRDSIASSLLELRRDKEFLDVSLLLSETDTVVMAHRVVLSAYVSPEDLDSVLAFMYNGEVKVRQDDLNSFLNVAEKLRVRGLCQGDKHASTSNKTPQQQRRRPSNNSSPPPPPPLKRPKTELQEDEEVSNDGEDELVIDDRVDNEDDEAVSERESSSPNSQHSLHNNVTGLKENDKQDIDKLADKIPNGPPDDPSEEYSEYGYAPDEGYNDKTIPPPVVGMMLGDRMDSLMDATNMNSGPWNSPNSGNSLNRSLHRLSSADSFGGRRPRSVYTTQQLTQLEAYFKFNEYIDGDRKKQLSIITQIPEQQIKVWFQNRRQKKKRELEEIQQNTASNFHSPLLETKQHS
ncbi:TFIIA1 [Lepeophtheirus salmonis]|uniref:TFIIA1 n=1 Tax=Lepeophtheirus salmonis TaxID=72036 RepID=A0A7R8H7B5_LEPSM|nr:TFIIA1 [Lepeophtheirus salmonis]CAF2917560.1 TFIIA1 [Lepeophtheirus salmonis]